MPGRVASLCASLMALFRWWVLAGDGGGGGSGPDLTPSPAPERCL